MERKQRILVGINEYVEPDEKLDIPILYIPEAVEDEQKRALEELRRTRDNRATTSALAALTAAAATKPGDKNVMEHILEAARTYATEGEIRNAMREVYGDYVESADF
jgi:methylmalonyl-CoA mutase N-terminal domain/subunit